MADISGMLLGGAVWLLASGQVASVVGPTWERRPSLPFPVEARGKLTEGRVLLNCLVLTNGFAQDCRIAREEPEGYGFGREALAATTTFRFVPATRNGVPYETRVTVPVIFRASR